jgi:uncharacterized protein YsxB (DUF464 family)
MITVKITRDKEQRMIAFHVNGHADSAPHGQDLVCGAVSALTQSAVLGLQQHLQRTIRCKAKHGLLSLELCDLPDEQTDAVLETMLLGLKEIVKLEPDYVRIVENRR